MIKIDRMMGMACGTCMEEYIHVKGLVGYHEGLRTLGRQTSKWEYNIKKYLQEIRWEGVVCIYLNPYS
jgi:hypothetical protein